LQPGGELDRQVGAFLQLPGDFGRFATGLAHFREGLQQLLEVLGNQLLSELRIAARPGESLFVDQFTHNTAQGRPTAHPSGGVFAPGYRWRRNLTEAGARCLSARFFAQAGQKGHEMAVAFLFPGQGSQSVGMGKALAANFPAAAKVFAEVDDALGVKLSDIVFEGPADTLTLTENAQPALMAMSLATLRVLETEAGLDLARDARFVAGHSLGEYSALAAAGAFSIADAARLLRTRGQAMQKAVPVGVGAMAALIGLDFDTASAIADEAAQGQVCQAANDNGAGQVVVSGDKAAVERAVEIAKAKGAKRAMLLPVSAPFHCALMAPAADVMAEALSKVKVNRPVVPVVANVRAHPLQDPAEIVHALVEQVTGTVRWRESVVAMAQAGVTEFYEIGAGKVLSGLVKRIADGASATAIGTPEDIAAYKAGRNS